MTTTISTPAYETGTLAWVHPGDLILERNIRQSKPDADLVRSIKTIGMLEPITAVINNQGALVVRTGHRRALAAIEAGHTQVPVYVTDLDDASNSGEITRIIEQRDENTLRAGLTAADEVAVVEQLTAFGLTAEQIVEQARIGKDKVDAATAVAGSKLAKRTAARYETLTLDQVAGIAEFDGDADIVKQLVVAAHEGRFDHALQRARDDREDALARAKVVAELEAAGIKVIDMPGYGDKATPLYRLAGKNGKELTRAAHAKCPGHAAYLGSSWQGGGVRRYVAEYACTDPAKNGHKDRWSTSASKPKAADLTDAEREKARTERRLVIDNNKAWASAETVRRSWLKTFASLKTPPKGAAAFIAVAISTDSVQFDYDLRPDELAAGWLGLKKSAGRLDLTPAIEGVSENRALQIALVKVLAIYEGHLTLQSWRSNGTTSSAGRYLRFLASCGYQLAEVEEYAISSKTV